MRLQWVRQFRQLTAEFPTASGPETAAQARASYLSTHNRIVSMLGELNDQPERREG